MIDIENLTEQELAELKQKLDKKLKHPICPCCGTRCGKYKEAKIDLQEQLNRFKKIRGWPIDDSFKPCAASIGGICNCTGACRPTIGFHMGNES